MSQRRVASKDELVNPETSQTTTAMESRYEVLGEGPAIRRYLLVPLLFIGIVVPFVLAGIYVPTKDGPDDDALEGWVLYSYVLEIRCRVCVELRCGACIPCCLARLASLTSSCPGPSWSKK